MSYKTLILIDNSSEITEVNRDTIRETVKYIINNLNEDEQIALAVTGREAEYLTDYEDSVTTQIKTAESIEYTDSNAPTLDVIMDVILNWKSGDLAYRDILLISGRGLAAAGDYSEEELLFEVSGKNYPIYSLACVQNENTACIKNLNSLSRISGGESVSTEDTASDAEVEKQLGDMLLNAMRTKREEESKLYSEADLLEEGQGEGSQDDTSVMQSEADEVEVLEAVEGRYDLLDEYGNIEFTEADTEEGNIIYEKKEPVPLSETVKNYAIPIGLIIFIALFFAISLELRNRKYKREDERFKESFRKPFEDDSATETVCLSSTDDDSDTGTRLLYQTREGLEITLEDRANPTKYFRACVRDSIVIGRNEKMCDLAISYDDSVSQRHCELFLRDGSLYCRDLGSSNGTMINQQKVYQEIKLESGDILRIGRLSFFIQILGDDYE